jgi:hypothetical protein
MAGYYSANANEVVNYATSVCGFNPSKRTTYPEFREGTISLGKQGTRWVYVKASETVATGTCTVTPTGSGNSMTFPLTDAAGNHTADFAFASGEYGWVRRTADDIA